MTNEEIKARLEQMRHDFAESVFGQDATVGALVQMSWGFNVHWTDGLVESCVRRPGELRWYGDTSSDAVLNDAGQLCEEARGEIYTIHEPDFVAASEEELLEKMLANCRTIAAENESLRGVDC